MAIYTFDVHLYLSLVLLLSMMFIMVFFFFFFFSSRRRHTRCLSDWSSDVCSSDLDGGGCQRTMSADAGPAVRLCSKRRHHLQACNCSRRDLQHDAGGHVLWRSQREREGPLRQYLVHRYPQGRRSAAGTRKASRSLLQAAKGKGSLADRLVPPR